MINNLLSHFFSMPVDRRSPLQRSLSGVQSTDIGLGREIQSGWSTLHERRAAGAAQHERLGPRHHAQGFGTWNQAWMLLDSSGTVFVSLLNYNYSRN